MHTILMTGAGAPGGPGIIKCLNMDKDKYKLIVGDINKNASGRYLANNFVLLPRADDPQFEQKILLIALKNSVNIIFPLVTKELIKLSRSKSIFLKHKIKILVSDYDGLKIANNKLFLYEHLKKYELPIPKFTSAQNTKELISNIIKLGYPKKNVVIKPALSNGSRGVRIIQNINDYYDLIFNQKPNNLFLDIETLKSQIADLDIPTMIISEYLPGEEITVDTISVSGKQILCLIRTRTKMNSGISVQGSFIENKFILSTCKKINQILKLNGPIGFQFKLASDNTYKLLEINPRIQGSSVTSLGLGINLPSIAIQSTIDPSFKINLKKTSGISFIRYYEEVYFKK